MKKIELPILYLSKESEVLQESGISSEVLSSATMTTFYLSDESFIRINARDDIKTTSLFINDDVSHYVVDAEYDAVQAILEQAFGIK